MTVIGNARVLSPAPGVDTARAGRIARTANAGPAGAGHARAQGSASRPQRNPDAEGREGRTVEQGTRAWQVDDGAMQEVLMQADLRSKGREGIDDDAYAFSSYYQDRDGADTSADEGGSGDHDAPGAGSGAAQTVPVDIRRAVPAAPATDATTRLVAELAADIVHKLTVVERDGRQAVHMELRHAKLPRTSVSLESSPERLRVTFESDDESATALLGREIRHLAASLAARRQCDCSVLVNTAPPESRTMHQSDAERPKDVYDTEGPAIRPRMA